jgi:hypothetical protein
LLSQETKAAIPTNALNIYLIAFIVLSICLFYLGLPCSLYLNVAIYN